MLCLCFVVSIFWHVVLLSCWSYVCSPSSALLYCPNSFIGRFSQGMHRSDWLLARHRWDITLDTERKWTQHIVEHINASNLTQHLNKYNILCDLQHGVRQKRSCESQLLQLAEDLGGRFVQGKQLDLVLLDFSKAFDKVNHLNVLFKLSQHGVKGNTLNWIRAFHLGWTNAVVLEWGGHHRYLWHLVYHRVLYLGHSFSCSTITTCHKTYSRR